MAALHSLQYKILEFFMDYKQVSAPCLRRDQEDSYKSKYGFYVQLTGVAYRA
jgi:hypothetical protein